MFILLASIVVAISSIAVYVNTDMPQTPQEPVVPTTDQNNKQPANEDLKVEEQTNTQQPKENAPLTVNLEGDMHDNGILKVSGTMSDEPKWITGKIWTGEGKDAKVIAVFQIDFENETQYEKKIIISDDFLWKENTAYNLDVRQGEQFKTVKFFRGTSENNFADSKIST